jgi:hypothetical protein
MRFAVAVALLLVLAAARPARAELWVSSMGQLLKDAQRIELIEVESTKRGASRAVVTGKILEALRSTRTKGTPVTIDLGVLRITPNANDRVLVVCDSECPRAVGIERDGWFQLVAQQPMDGAIVYPNVVAHVAIPALAAGKPAPSICVRGTIALLDTTATPAFTAQVSAADGSGTAAMGSNATLTARMSLMLSSRRDDAVAIQLSHGTGQIQLGTDHIARAADGCLEGKFEPDRPVVRTEKGLASSLDGKFASRPFARGSLAISKGAPFAGTHAITLALDEYGQLVLDSDFARGTADYRSGGNDRLTVGFPIKDTGTYPKLLLDFETGKQTVIAALAARRSLKISVSLLTDASRTGPTRLGTVTLQYMPE